MTVLSSCSEAPVYHEGKDRITLGDWFTFESEHYGKVLAAVSKVGSNHVQLSGLPMDGLHDHRGRLGFRIHVRDLHTLTPCPNWMALITDRVQQQQDASLKIMQAVEALTRRLGVAPRNIMISHPGTDNDTGKALTVLSGTQDVKQYQIALEAAEQSDLPALFKQMKAVQADMAHWMALPMLPMEIAQDRANDVMDPLRDRIFQVRLYSGLSEEVVQIASGEPAAYHDKLHVFQIKRYMDEECLLNYQAGGIDITHIEAFDAWLAEPENRDRVLPMPRCMVAMQVRRVIKDRDDEGSLRQMCVNVQLGKLDRLTFLFVRNGDNLYRINTEIAFPDLIFPSSPQFMDGEAILFKSYGASERFYKGDFMTAREHAQLMQEQAARDQQAEQWFLDNPLPEWSEKWLAEHPSAPADEAYLETRWGCANPFLDGFGRKSYNRLNDYVPLTPDALYYDEAMEAIAKHEQEFNRIALIIQGLLDRSEVLHPHPPVNLGTQAGSETMLVLVKDGSAVLTHGDAPDFEAYRSSLNAQITADSIFTGQDTAWARREGEKETRRMDHSWRERSREWRPKYFRPFDDPGPGDVASAKKVFFDKTGRATKVTFSWLKPKRADIYGENMMEKTITLPVSDLLNISAYQPGDYKKFFSDPRTRADYLQWAPLLLEAEKWHQEQASRKATT